MKSGKLKRISGIAVVGFFALFFGQVVYGQDSTATEDCSKWRGLYFQYLKQKMYRDAATMWNNALKSCGETGVDMKFWANGRVIYTGLAKEAEALPDVLKGLNDSICWIYEARMACELRLNLEPDSEWALDYVVFLMTLKDDRHDKLDHLFKHIHVLKHKTKPSTIKKYFTHLITNKFNAAEGDAKEQMRSYIIEEYMILTDYLSIAMTVAKEAADEKEIQNIQNAQDFLDKYFLQLAADCTILTAVFEKQLGNLPQLHEAKKKKVTEMLSLMDKKGCSGSATYGKYLDTLIQLDPTAEAYYLAGRNQEENDKMSQAIEYYQKAIELEGDGTNKDKYQFALANAQYKNNSYKSAFNSAKLVQGELRGEALTICAASVAALANGCGESTFQRKANFWLANDYIRRAIDAGKTGISSSKYLDNAPGSTDCFTEGLQMGSSYTLTCWGESTIIR